MYAPKAFFSQSLLILFLLLALVTSVTAGILLRESAQAQASSARRTLAAQLMPEIQKCARLGRKMGYAGADIRGQLLPELKTALPAMIQLNQAVRDICGVEYMPVDEALLRRINYAAALLEGAYRRSDSAAAAEEGLRQSLMLLEGILASRFSFDGDLLPAA